jgi:CO/xanthine dehydrogenase FAD-binding subunit
MPKRPTGYYRPKTIDEAIELLARPDTVPLAGGTDLLTRDVDAAVVDLQDLGLDNIDFDKERLTVGSMTRLADLKKALSGLMPIDEHDGPLGGPELLSRAIHQAGANTYRNSATLGGIIASRLPDSELIAALLTFESELTIQGFDEETVGLSDHLMSDPRPKRLIKSISIEWTAGRGASHRVARTPSDYPIVSVSVWQAEDGSIRLAATGTADLPIRLTAAEEEIGRELTEMTVAKAAEAAKAAISHPGDFRGDTTYRSEMAAVLTKRALNDLIEDGS